MELNSRELAFLVWTAILVAATLLWPKVRPSALAVLKAAMHRKIVGVVAAGATYAAACSWALFAAQVWTWGNLKTTLFWFIGTGLPTIADAISLHESPARLRKLAKDAFALTAFILFIGSLNTMPFWAEFLLLPVLTFVCLLVAVAERQEEHRIVVGPLNMLLVGAGLYILGYSIAQAIEGWNEFDAAFQARELATPILLTLMFLPFLYALMVVVTLENAAIRLGFSLKDAALRRSAWRNGVWRFGGNIQIFTRYVRAIQMADVKDRADIRRIARTIRRARQREKCPPMVDWNLGWSPYLAREFLAEQGLRTRPYDPGLVDWSGNSERLKLDNDAWGDSLTYTISGTEDAVTELHLELDVQDASKAEASDERFWLLACFLVLQALGDEPAERFASVVPTDDPLTFPAGEFSISAKRDDWVMGKLARFSRTLTILHPAHRDPFA